MPVAGIGSLCDPGPSCISETGPKAQNNDRELAFLKPLPNSCHYLYCCGRIHVALLAKLIAILYLPIYGCLLGLLLYASSATTVMFALLLFGSVAYSTIYGTFKGSRLCLIPFIFLQVILILYDAILFCMCGYALIDRQSFLFGLLLDEPIPFGLRAQHAYLAFLGVLAFLFGPLLISTHVVYLDYVFISHIDEMLDNMRDLEENNSNEDPSAHHF